MQQGRSKRVAELIRQEIAKLITNGLKDPRVGFVSVTGVKMSPDLHYANVYVSLFGSETERKGSLAGLRSSSGWMRKEIGKHLRLRVTPEVRFFQDDSLDRVYELEEVFEQIHEEQRQAPLIRVDLNEIARELRETDSFLITSHVNPDGDALGSMLGLKHLLHAMGKQRVHCVLSDPTPEVYRSLPGADKILNPDAEIPEFDLGILLDVSTAARTGDVEEWLEEAPRLMVIDHHIEDDADGAVGFIDASYGATGEIIADLFQAAEVTLSKEAAHCLYVAQVTDTGGFRYSNTSARSHYIAARLHESGIDTAAMCEEVFGLMPVNKVHLLRRMLDRLEFRCAGAIATSYVTEDDLAELNAGHEDTNGLINYLRNVVGVRVGVLFHGLGPALTKVSFRSDKNFNSAEFLQHFGGGGHAAAAGATVEQPLDEVRDQVLDRLEQHLGVRA